MFVLCLIYILSKRIQPFFFFFEKNDKIDMSFVLSMGYI